MTPGVVDEEPLTGRGQPHPMQLWLRLRWVREHGDESETRGAANMQQREARHEGRGVSNLGEGRESEGGFNEEERERLLGEFAAVTSVPADPSQSKYFVLD